jgi:hypothetical protein
MYRTVRPSSKEVFPLFAGWWIHRHNIPNMYLIYCASMLMLLQPWFGLEEVMEGYDSFVDAFDEFKENARVTSPLGTRGSFFTKLSNQNVRIPIYFVYRGILVCSLH